VNASLVVDGQSLLAHSINIMTVWMKWPA